MDNKKKNELEKELQILEAHLDEIMIVISENMDKLNKMKQKNTAKYKKLLVILNKNNAELINDIKKIKKIQKLLGIEASIISGFSISKSNNTSKKKTKKGGKKKNKKTMRNKNKF